jgi:hypothetical protein
MSTLILTDQHDGAYVIPRRSRARERLLTRLRSRRLDAAIADGACPDSTAALSLRANKLIGRGTRRQLARGIGRLLRDSRRPPHPVHERAPVCWGKVLRTRAFLEDIADRLLGPGPVDARGVALVRLLLSDGTSPLFSHQDARDLKPALEAALDALEPRL